jgi:hypothetical protein
VLVPGLRVEIRSFPQHADFILFVPVDCKLARMLGNVNVNVNACWAM